MTDQQSTPLSAEALRELAVAYRPDRDAAANVMRLADLRREIIAHIDAARERPSALDVETLATVIADTPVTGTYIEQARRIAERYARLTEPDAGEGAEHASTNDARVEPFMSSDSNLAAATPDTTEATLRAAWVEGWMQGAGQMTTWPPEALHAQAVRQYDRRAALQQPAAQGGPE